MTNDEIVDLVKAKLDELTPYNETLVVSGVSYADQTLSYINKLLPESGFDLASQAPLHLLSGTQLSLFKNYSYTGGYSNYSNYVIEDNVLKLVINQTLSSMQFIRLKSLKLKSWSMKVNETITIDHPRYKLQGNKYTRGTPSRPVVVFEYSQLSCYTTNELDVWGDNSTNNIGEYIRPVTTQNCPDILIDSLTWNCAAKVLVIYGKIKEAEVAMQMYKSSLMR